MYEPEPKPEPRDHATIFLVSAAVMIFQIALTRVLSVVVWYHFAFLVISVVMLGLGVPGVWFALIREPQRHLPSALWLSGVAVPAAVMALVRFGADALEVSSLSLIACVLPATLALGSVVCLLLMKARGAAISRMYGWDLLGAGIGALAVIPLLHAVPTPALVAGLGFLPLSALALHPGRPRFTAIVTSIGLALVIGATDSLQVTRSKSYDEREMRPIYEKWSPTARISVFDESFFYLASHRSGFTWGRGRNYPQERRIRQYWLEQDAGAGTAITAYRGDLSEVEHLLYDVTSLGLQVHPSERTAIVGGGGGRDILAALSAGADGVDVVELNADIVEAVSVRFGEFSGDPYHAPGVRAFVAEGRSFLTRATATYDLIQISLIDSWAASAAGAFALAENNLYTVEAFDLYLDRLAKDGVIALSRWVAEMPRLIILSNAALAARGVAEPARHLVLARANDVGTLLLSPAPFSKEDIERLRHVSRQRGFTVIHPEPAGSTPRHPFLAELIAGDYGRMRQVGLVTAPPVDDSPYFFQTVSPFRGSGHLEGPARDQTGLAINRNSSDTLRDSLLWVSALGGVLFFAPFAAGLLRSGSQDPAAPLMRASLYFAAIGAGFMLFETMLVHRFVLYLGHPSHAATVVLASLLLGMGAGSALATRIGVAGLQTAGFGAAIGIAVLVVALPPSFASTLGWPFPARVLASCAVLLPTGATLGLFFPLGMLRFGDEHKPWLWAINGAFGVVASVFSLALSMELGFAVVGWTSAAIYAGAWLCLRDQAA